ncbi:MAG: enoyl-CoA hydratase/isomerase family protein [Caldilineaceae bacterium]|nr:enoyl-CoA hydratase/isomerase family protein [Caldilineaceae bacterium]
MPLGINHVTVIGAGTMGAAIAGQFANAGIPVTLLDMVPTTLTPDEERAGLTLAHPNVRNRIVQAGFDRMIKARPNNLFTPDVAKRIKIGNLEDDFAATLAKSDWIIEVIVERPAPKQALMTRIEAAAPAHAVISTNTSGIPIHVISEGRSAAFKKRFLGTHFFNPPRYLPLLEVIPTPETDPAMVARIRTFGERVLGKGVVICKDTPNFIANRMFSFIISDVIEYALEQGYTVEEVDRLTGDLLGRPKTGTFRLGDVVGVDVMALVNQNLYPLIPADEDREILLAPRTSAVLKQLIDQKLLGSKTGQGFYKTVVGAKGEKEFWSLDLKAAEAGQIDYVPPAKPRWESVGALRDKPIIDRLVSLTLADDPAGKLIWHTLSHTMAYASKRIPEITDSVADLDNVMKWGFGWKLGPFETWDRLGVAETVTRMAADGLAVAPWVTEMLANGCTTFYAHPGPLPMVYSPLTKGYVPVERNPLVLKVDDLRRTKSKLAENESASLLQLDDGVLLLEFHSKMNALDAGSFAVMQQAIDKLYGKATGLVIANEGENFSVGANLLMLGMLAQAGQWQELEQVLRQGQDAFMALRTAPKPVVAAPFQRVLGGGVEVCLAADRIVAHAETYMGLVEMGVGIIPGWGGCKEMVRRHLSPHMHATNVNPTPYLRQVFETIGLAKVSSSAAEAQALGFLLPSDEIVMNREHQLGLAKQAVVSMAAQGYQPPVVKNNVYAAGRDVLASTQIEIYSMRIGGFISEHDAKIATKLASTLCGGDLSAPAWMDEQYFLDLEREALISLAGEAKTQERIWSMLQNGKPLRN